MSSRGSNREPERLMDGKFGGLLREANREFVADLDQPAAFRRVTASLARRTRSSSRFGWLLPASPFAVAALAALLLLVYRQGLDATPELVAEHWHIKEKPKEALPAAQVAAPSAVDEPPLPRTNDESPGHDPKRASSPTSVRSSTRTTAASRPSAPLPSQSEATPVPPVATSDSMPKSEQPSEGPDCLSLARRGQTRAAEACFLERAQGSGLAAEMALYEVARLRRDVLADANGALEALTEYRKRFPAGSLRREADMSQLELLLQLGRSDEALKRSDELLSASASGERAPELRLLRGHILRKQSRFAAAEREYELAEGPGGRGGESTYFRALCLEALGRTGEAAAMLTKYLTYPERRYAEDARRRLGRLTP